MTFRSFLVLDLPHLNPEIIQRLSTPKLRDHMCQTTPCQNWCCTINCGRGIYMKSWDNCGFFCFFTEKTVFIKKLNGITTFHKSQRARNFSLASRHNRAKFDVHLKSGFFLLKCRGKGYMQSQAKCEFFGRFTEKTVFMTKINDITIFCTSQKWE